MPQMARGFGIDMVSTLHGCDETTTTMTASPTVLVNTIGAHRLTDLNTTHTIPCGDNCCSHTQPLTTASPTVIVNTLGSGRVGDMYVSCGMIVSGSPTVFVNGAV